MAKMSRERKASRVRFNLKTKANTLRQKGSVSRLRLCVFRSEQHIYAQIIDDAQGSTLVSASTVDKKLRKDITKTGTAEAAAKVGKAIGERAKAAGIKDVYFDRGSFRYHGKVKALADAAREAGLNF